jgi:large subunit ribosomal protein L25
MADFVVHAQARTLLGKSVKTLRRQGILPAVVYGHEVQTRNIAVQQHEFNQTYRRAGESTLVDLVVDQGAPVKVIIQDVRRHPVTGDILHVDFHQVRMSEKIHAEIPLSFIGESVAVKELGGVLVKNVDHVEVEALPGDLLREIAVDISPMKTFEDIIHIRDLKLPTGITVLDQPDEVICLVTPPRSQQELEELEAKVEEKVEEVEGVQKEEQPATEEGEVTPPPQQSSNQ